VRGSARARGAGWDYGRRALVAGLALVWCVVLAAVLVSLPPDRARAAGESSSQAGLTHDGSAVQRFAGGDPSATATAAAATQTAAATTPTATATQAAPTATISPPTPTSVPAVATSNSSGSGAGNSGGAAGPQPTVQNLAAPTIGADQGGPTASFSPSNLSSPWMLVFSTLGCVLGVIALGTLLVTWYLLVSDGWGPLVKAVLLGNRKGKRHFTRRKAGATRGTREPERAPVPAMRQRGGWH
jgi:hypothetical protein